MYELLEAEVEPSPRLEHDINIVPYGSGDCRRETHSYDGVRLILDEREIRP